MYRICYFQGCENELASLIHKYGPKVIDCLLGLCKSCGELALATGTRMLRLENAGAEPGLEVGRLAFHWTHFTGLISLDSFHWTHFTALISLYSFHCTHFTVLTSPYSLHRTHFTGLISLYSLHWTHFTVQ